MLSAPAMGTLVANVMKFSVIICILIIFFSCRNDRTKKISDEKYFYTKYLNGKIDTNFINKVSLHQLPDTLIAKEVFVFNNKSHIIRKYTSDNHAAIDGGALCFELDSLGIIFSKSTTWNSYTRLHSTNYSIENILNTAIEIIILNDNLSCYDYRAVFGPEKINFTKPNFE